MQVHQNLNLQSHSLDAAPPKLESAEPLTGCSSCGLLKNILTSVIFKIFSQHCPRMGRCQFFIKDFVL
jgi:hypothetical protein